MVDTVRTRSDLLTALFQDGQSANSITAQDMRDLIVSLSNRGGWADYNDSTTTGTPISITGGAGYTDLTNDGAGSNSQNRFVHPSITDLWDTATNSFDFSELELYDTVGIRTDLSITTSTTNTDVTLALEFASGDAAEFDLVIDRQSYKSAGTFQLETYTSFYIGSAAVRTNPAKIKVQADNNISVVVNGWFIKAEKY